MKDHGWVYEDEGVWVYRASTFGSCIRSLVSARLGESAFPFNASIQAAMDASSGLEDVILNRIIAELGGKLIWQQKEVELDIPLTPDVVITQNGLETSDPIIRGHIDALRQDDDSIIEAKALGPTNFAKYNSGGLDALGNLGKKYTWQGAIYGHATGRKVRFVIGEKVKTEGELKDDSEYVGPATWEIDNLIIEPPVDPQSLVPLEEIVARVQEVERYAAEDVLPDCDANCKPGDPYEECHIFPSALLGGDELETKLLRYSELKDLLGDADKGTGLLGEYEDIKEWIKQEYGDERETRKVTVGPFNVTVVANKGQSRVDSKWLRKSHPDIYEQALVPGRPYRTLIVKKVGDG